MFFATGVSCSAATPMRPTIFIWGGAMANLAINGGEARTSDGRVYQLPVELPGKGGFPA